MKNAIQRFSRSALVPVKFMAVMGIFLAFSVIMNLDFMPGPVRGLGGLIKAMMDVLMGNLALIFCVAIAGSMAKKNKIEAVVLALMVFFIFLAANNAWLTNQGMLTEEGAVGLYGTGQNFVLGFQVVDMNVFLGMILGPLTAYIHNKFSDKNFIDMFSIYGGPRLAFIVMIPITLVLAIVLCYIWPVINSGINSTSAFMYGAGALGVFLYGFGNRFLIPTGLHHLLWMPFCFTAIGGSLTIGGETYTGAVNIFYAQMSNVSSVTALDPSIRFAFYGFSKVFSCIPIALAIIHCAKKAQRDEVKGLVMPGAFVGTVAGITEPLDFAYLFAAPQLWLAHSVLAGISEALLWQLGIRTMVKDGIIDTVICNSVFSPGITKVIFFILFGLIAGLVWYVVFVFLIKKFNLNTPGRGDAPINDVVAEGTITSETTTSNGPEFQTIIDGLGGKDNIDSMTNCFTRLRVDVKDTKKVNEALIKKYPGQKGVVIKDNNVQVIIGMGVQPLKEQIAEHLGIE